ncbi:uncharacterized protein LOC113327589 [Papaver somniferum]|uniref:uncharacterized protein LOC113327589 n=1 Tax=Papaver somniferum TaxID=3469 RepID=UPI000E70231B|nr:uncharacterized protein LOC113327589 [Papaver somniferum]
MDFQGEARKWFSRAKQNQFKWGESNTSYFHKIANSRRKRNTIAKLEIDGVDCFNQGVIKEEMRNYFVSLFTAQDDVSFKMNNLHFPVIEEELKVWMKREFSEEEVFDVIKHMGKNKSPGPDGFYLEFYKKCWHIIKDDFMKMMVEFHTYSSWDWRLKVAMPVLISDFQGAFIKEKQILDGVLVAGECIDSRLKAKIPSILCKIDMEKSFDNVKWKALFCILKKHGFGDKWISWLEWCITSSNISVLVNGSSSEKFKPTKRSKARRCNVSISISASGGAMELKLTRIMRNFLWDSAEDKRKMCWVSWRKIYTPMNKGGLGVKNLKLTNLALLSKWIWRYTKEKDALWRRIAQEKFKGNKDLYLPVDDNRFPAAFKACKNKNASIAEMVVNGRLQCNTRRTMTGVEQLEWDSLCNELGLVPDFAEEMDEISFEGDFSVKKIYEMQLEEAGAYSFQKFLWKKQVLAKVSFLLWAYMHNSIPTLPMLRHRGVEVASDRCYFCHSEVEDADHIFVTCKYAHEIWMHFLEAFKMHWVMPNTLQSLFEIWSQCKLRDRCKDVWEKIHYVIICHIWKQRNDRAFGARHKPVSEMILLIKQDVVLWLHEKETLKFIPLEASNKKKSKKCKRKKMEADEEEGLEAGMQDTDAYE